MTAVDFMIGMSIPMTIVLGALVGFLAAYYEERDSLSVLKQDKGYKTLARGLSLVAVILACILIYVYVMAYR